MNKLRSMFCPTLEEQEEDKRRIESIVQSLKDDKHCSYCVNSVRKPYFEMGHDAGTVTYCNVLNELRLGYPTGDQCLFWKLKEDI